MPPKPKRVTRGSASKKQRQEIQSLATGSSPPKGTKKLTEKQASFKSPSAKKQAKSSGESNSDGNSTGNEDTSVTTIAITMTTMTTPFNAQLIHVLINCLSAAGADHQIRKAFIHKDVLTFENFTNICTVENIKTFQQDDGNNNLVQAFSSAKLTMVNNVILYYNFLQDDSQERLAEDPVNWDKADFRK